MLLCCAVFETQIGSSTVCFTLLDTSLIGRVQYFLVSSIRLTILRFVLIITVFNCFVLNAVSTPYSIDT